MRLQARFDVQTIRAFILALNAAALFGVATPANVFNVLATAAKQRAHTLKPPYRLHHTSEDEATAIE